MAVKLIKVRAKEIFTRTKLPGCDWVVNQYIGCEHNCLYCYAKFISRWRPSNYGKWGTWLEVKTNASGLVKAKKPDGWVYMSSISDPYQPVEKKLGLTRAVLENMNKDIKLCIQTKSDLVLRDTEIFKEFKTIEVGLTINGFSEKVKSVFEPFSASNEKRISALKTLKRKGIKTFAFISPILPKLVDLKKVIESTKNFVDYYWFEFINLKGAGKEFSESLRRNFPDVFRILTDPKEFPAFIENSKKIIRSGDVKIRGVVRH